MTPLWCGGEMKGEGRQRDRERHGEAYVALVTGTLHCNDFNRSPDTHMHTQMHAHRFLHADTYRPKVFTLIREDFL